jgi:chaperonin GroEL (HSP60 family)
LGIKLEDATVDMLGKADKVISTKDNTVIVDGKGNQDEINERAEQIKAQIGMTKSDYDKELDKGRLKKIHKNKIGFKKHKNYFQKISNKQLKNQIKYNK